MKKHNFFLITLFITHLFLLINLRFEAWPEMLVYPYLIKNQYSLFKDIINPYLPLFNWFLTGYFTLFKLTVNNLKLLTYAIIFLSDYLIFFIAKKRYGAKPAFTALIFFVSFQPLLDGNGLWYDLVLVPFLLLAFDKSSPWLLSLAFFIKQSVFWLLPIFIQYYKKLIISLITLFILSCTPFILSHTLNDYLFWAWQYPFTLFPKMPGHKDWGTLAMWTLAIFPFILPLSFARRRLPKLKTLSQQPIFWMLTSYLFIFPRFGLFHLQPALAFAALTLAQNYKHIKIKDNLIKLSAICYLLFAGFFWYRQIKFFWHQPTRFFEASILKAAYELEKQTSPDDILLFLNAPDQLMVLSNRLPTKPWAITFPWYLEIPGMQKRFINALSDQQVKTVVFSAYQDQGQYSPGSYIPTALNQAVQAKYSHVTILPNNIFLLKK